MYMDIHAHVAAATTINSDEINILWKKTVVSMSFKYECVYETGIVIISNQRKGSL